MKPFPDLSGISVLVVDDDTDSRMLLAETLEYAGATVSAAAAADVVLPDVSRLRPAVIVLDLAMPRMDGVTFLRRLRAHPDPSIRATPVVAVTAYYERFNPSELRAEGCQEYMEKPVSLDRVCATVRRLGRVTGADGVTAG